MSTPSLNERVEKIVDAFVHQNQSFTLLDVSEEVKHDGHGWVSHSTIKPIIEDVLRASFTKIQYQYYTVTTIAVSTPVGPSQARLFHPVNVDPLNYLKTKQKATPPLIKKKVTKKSLKKKLNKTTKKASVIKTNSSSNDDLPTNHPTLTGRLVKRNRKPIVGGYVEVPKTIWEEAGFTRDSEVFLDIHPDSITVYRISPYSKYNRIVTEKIKAGGITSKVPPAGRFRISPKHLAAAGLLNKILDFSHFTDKFVISKKVKVSATK